MRRSTMLGKLLVGAAVSLTAVGCQPEDEPEDTHTITVINGVVDFDGDGHTADDCNDKDPAAYFGAPETPYDGVDQDCNGMDLIDVDGDGFPSKAVGGPDCNDDDSAIRPGALEVPGDGIDQDCSGADFVDLDGDGYAPGTSANSDCDDQDPFVHPGALELVDGQDNDCDGFSDELPYGGEVPADQASAKVEGSSALGELGAESIVVGDWDRSGTGDLLAGLPGEGKVLLFLGQGDVFSKPGELEPATSFRAAPESGVGTVLARGGDMDGDGWMDLAFGAPLVASGAGAVYLELGGSSGLPAEVLLGTRTLSGLVAGDGVGSALAMLDINGDGKDDLAAGAPGVSWQSEAQAGVVYVYLGRPRAELSSGTNVLLPYAAALKLVSTEAGSQLGASLGTADLNADGWKELLVGAPGAPGTDLARAGEVALFYGQSGLSGELGLDRAAARFLDDLSGAEEAGAGQSLVLGCDVNGDGRGDLLIGAPLASGNGLEGRGRVHLFLSGSAPFAGNKLLSKASITWWGAQAGDMAGASLACPGDINGDGYDDVLVGTPGFDGSRGAAWLLFGSPDGLYGSLDAAQGAVGFVGLTAGDRLGTSTSGGDLNGDGLDDLVVGAPERTVGDQSRAGALYLFAGAKAH